METKEMKLFYVYKKKWNEYYEDKGFVVASTTWQRAKGVAMDMWKDQRRDNIEVKEVDVAAEGFICSTSWARVVKEEI